MMVQVSSNARRLTRVLSKPLMTLRSFRASVPNADGVEEARLRDADFTTFSSESNFSSGIGSEKFLPLTFNTQQRLLQHPTLPMRIPVAFFSSTASEVDSGTTEALKEIYDKIIKYVVEQRTAPPNAWLWSLIESCVNHEDIKLLFDSLQNLRRFRLSHLRIHENFNFSLCLEVAKACARVGAVDFGKKTLWKHNVYGLTPSAASAHCLLLYAKRQNDVKLMVDIVKLLKLNGLSLQPGTADIIFSICYNTDNWDMISKYSKMFVKAGVKLRRTSFDTWMTFAAKLGDMENLWKIETLRSKSEKMHTVASGLSCAKGFLLERKTDNAAEVVQLLYQTFPEAKWPNIMVDLQKLVSEWPYEVIKHCKEEERKALATALQDDIPFMVDALLGLGLNANLDVGGLTKKGLFS